MTDISEQIKWIIGKLRPWATRMYAQYGYPVYLVGSALERRWPRDIDIIIIMPQADWVARFGQHDEKREGLMWDNPMHHWAEAMGKENAALARSVMLNVDFRVITEEQAIPHKGKVKIRIDPIKS